MSQQKPTMPSDQLEDRYLHLKTVHIDGTLRASKLKVVSKHKSGFTEKSEASGRPDAMTWQCNTYIDPSATTNLEVHRAGKFLKCRSKTIEFKLGMEANEIEEDKSVRLTNNGLNVELTFGTSKTQLEVAHIRVADAIAALESKKRMIDKLEVCVHYSDLVIQVGSGPAELLPAAQVAFSVASLILKKVQDIPNAHQGFTDVIHDMGSILPTVKIAMELFSEENVRVLLKQFVNLVGKTSQEVIKCYSSSKLVFLWRSSKQDEIVRLKNDVQKMVQNTDFAVNVDVKRDIVDMQRTLATLRDQFLSEGDGKLLDGLKPPGLSSYDPAHCCLPGTRIPILHMIQSWAPRNDQSSRLFWLYGVAGSGKSSVAASVASELEKLKLLSGSFFCKRDVSERRDPVRMIQSLAHFLARANKHFGAVLLRVLREDSTILEKPLRSQFEMLLANPLSEISDITLSVPIIVVIDALDECDDSQPISRFLARMVKLAPWLRLIVTSRPTQEIGEGLFKSGTFMTKHDLFVEDAHDDILSYIQYEFSSEGSLSTLQSEVSLVQVEGLAEKAQGLFIWTATVMKHVRVQPYGRLKVIEDILSSKSASSAETELDALYLLVLRSATGTSPAEKDVVRLVAGLIFVTSRNKQISSKALHAFLCRIRELRVRVSEAELNDLVLRLGSVLIKDEQTDAIRVLHPSFLDFIENEHRSDIFWTRTAHLEAVMGTACLDIMGQGLRFNICDLNSSDYPNSDVQDLEYRIANCISQDLQYSSLYWLDHLSGSEVVSTSQHRVRQMLHDLICSSQVLYWLEAMSLMGELSTASRILQQLPEHLKTYLNDAEVRDTASDLRRFIALFHSPMSLSTPHIYLSALLLVPSESTISKRCRRLFIHSEPIDDRIEYFPPNLQALRVDSVVLCVAFSPDGSRIVSGSLDKTIRVWDAHSGAPVGEPLQGHNGMVMSVGYSPDGTQIVSGSEDKTIRVWDAQTGAPVGEPLQGHNGMVLSVGYSPDGTRIVSGSDDNTIRVWDAHSGAPVGEPLQGHNDAVLSVGYSPDGTRIVSGSEDNTIRVRDAHSGDPVDEPLQGHSGAVWSVGYSPDGTRILSGSLDNTIPVWDAETSTPIGGLSRDESRWDPVEQHFVSIPKPSGTYGPPLSLAYSAIPLSVPSDGWIRTLYGGLLLWIPEEHRHGLCDMSLFCVPRSATGHPLRVEWKRLCYGNDWTKIMQEEVV